LQPVVRVLVDAPVTVMFLKCQPGIQDGKSIVAGALWRIAKSL
jgi:hypothetical protein